MPGKSGIEKVILDFDHRDIGHTRMRAIKENVTFSRYHNRGNKKEEALSSFSPLSSDSGKFEWCRISAPVPREIFNSNFFFRCDVKRHHSPELITARSP